MRVLGAHDLRTLGQPSSLRPKAVSEQMLTAQMIPRLPAGAAIVADSNFGTFAVAYQATQAGHPVVVRLTEVRAQALGGLGLNAGADQKVLWKPLNTITRAIPICQPIANQRAFDRASHRTE